MTNKLILNEQIREFLNSDDKDLWNLILEDKIDEISPREDILLDKIILELFSEKQSATLNGYDFVTLKETNSTLFKDMVRLVLALDVNGKHDDLRLLVGDKLFDLIPDVVNNIKEQSKGYPRNPMNALVWAEGAGFRAALNALIYYYRLKDNADTLHFLIMNAHRLPCP